MAMSTRLQSFWQALVGGNAEEVDDTPRPVESKAQPESIDGVDIAPDDPIVA